MDNFVRNLLTEWRKLELPFENAAFVVAVSGGADSVGLLLALFELRKRKKLNNRFVVAHFDHQLRGLESEMDAVFVASLCEKFDFELVLEKGNLPPKGNLEQNARLARYEFLTRLARNLSAEGILTAHTLNDQAETFLLNLIRGSGLQGLAGMKALRSDFGMPARASKEKSGCERNESPTRLIRPLLNWAKREDTENFCRGRKIEFRLDTMNEDLSYNRVRIRKILLPMLGDFNPKIVETLAQTADLLGRQAEMLEKIGDQSPAFDQQILTLKELKSLPRPLLLAGMRRWLEKKRGDLRNLDLKHFEAIERLIMSRKSGRVVELPNGETIEKKGGKLFFKQ